MWCEMQHFMEKGLQCAWAFVQMEIINMEFLRFLAAKEAEEELSMFE